MTIPGIEAEEALLGAILNHGAAYHEAATIINDQNDIYKEEYRLIWRAMEELNNEGKKIDPTSVEIVLRRHEVLTRAGGAAMLRSLFDALADVGNVAFYAKAVNDAARGRDLKREGRRMMNDSIPPHVRLDIAYSGLAEINERAAHGRRVSIGDVTSQIMADRTNGNGSRDRLKTGFYNLDVPLGGLQAQHLIILGARPSIGKSALALQIAMNVAEKGGHVLFVSPEMTQKQLGTRLLSIKSGVPYKLIDEEKELKADDEDALNSALDTTRLLPITIDDASAQTVTQIKLKARQCAGESRGLALVVVDYLQLLCEGDDDKAAVTKISKGLKAMAKDLEVPVLACSQLRRRYGHEPKRPDKSRLKGSGQQEQDADSIILIWNPTDEPHRVEAFIDKNRHGPLGQTMLKLNLETTRFTEKGEVW
jgi:replicative DNA helicase